MLRLVPFLALLGCAGEPTPPEKQDSKEHTQKGSAHEEHKEDKSPGEVATKPTLKENTKVFFISPEDGASVTSPVTIEFGIEGAEVKPAGENIPNSGHHHLIINGSGIEHGVVVPKDETHIHYGKGQTTAEVPLTPGEYTLTMQFANFLHQSYGEAGATSIKITVTE